jgi:hypothetical protein
MDLELEARQTRMAKTNRTTATIRSEKLSISGLSCSAAAVRDVE